MLSLSSEFVSNNRILIIFSLMEIYGHEIYGDGYGMARLLDKTLYS